MAYETYKTFYEISRVQAIDLFGKKSLQEVATSNFNENVFHFALRFLIWI